MKVHKSLVSYFLKLAEITAHKNGLKGRKNILTYADKQVRKNAPIPMSIFTN